MKVLLTGAKGQLGRCFSDRCPAGWNILATDSNTLDITDLDQVKKLLQRTNQILSLMLRPILQLTRLK